MSEGDKGVQEGAVGPRDALGPGDAPAVGEGAEARQNEDLGDGTPCFDAGCQCCRLHTQVARDQEDEIEGFRKALAGLARIIAQHERKATAGRHQLASYPYHGSNVSAVPTPELEKLRRHAALLYELLANVEDDWEEGVLYWKGSEMSDWWERAQKAVAE